MIIARKRTKLVTELSLWIVVFIVTAAFLAEYVDSSLGMGYGTILVPVLLLFGFSPMQIVPAILVSELITGLLAGFFHHKQGNVNFKPKTIDIFLIIKNLKSLGCIESFKENLPLNLKTALILAVCSIAGVIIGASTAVNISNFWIRLYIGFLLLAMGVIIIAFLNKKFQFSWGKIMTLGLIASFNKGISGGGYGPLVTGGQILTGIEGKSAVGITSLAEGLTCMVGVITYVVASRNPIDWRLAPWIIAGAVVSVPFSALSVKKISCQKMKLAIAVLSIILGGFTIIRTFYGI